MFPADRRLRLRIALASTTVVVVAMAAWALDPELAKQAVSEKIHDRWVACEPLAKDGSPEALKLLLGILKADPDCEMRDHALWACQYLPNDSAVDLVAAATTGERSPALRRNLAAALAKSRRPHAVDTLARIAKNDADVSVRCEAVESAWYFPDDPRAVDLCRAGFKSSDQTTRAAAVVAAGALNNGAGHDVVLAGWASADEGVRCAALGAMHNDESPSHFADAAASKGWRLRAQCVNTALYVRTPAAVETLIGLVGDPSRRVARAAARSLQFLSGKDIAPDVDLWRAWWEANKATWKAPAGRFNDVPERPPDPKATRARFQGLEVETERAAFVIDASGSMTNKLKSGATRAEAVREELERTLDGLPDGFRANLILFGSEVHACFDAARPLSPKTRKDIVQFAASTPAKGGTNLAGGLFLALADDGIDTIYLLTDGVPSEGEFVSDSRVRVAVRRANRTRLVAIHAVGFGVRNEDDRKFLADLASDGGGRCVFR